MIQEKLDRINELARLKKERALTPEEISEQETLRREYITEWRKGAVQVLESVRVQMPDGRVVPLEKKKGRK